MKGSPPCDQRWWSELLPLRYGCGFSSSQCSGSHHPHLISRGLFIHRVYAWVARWRISRRMRFWFPGPGFWGHPLGPDPGRISDGEWAVFAPSLKISWGCCPALGNLGHSHLLGSWLCPPESSTPGRLDFLISLFLACVNETKDEGREGRIQSAKIRPGADCGSEYELLIAKFTLKLKKIGKISRPLRFDLNQIPYYYAVEVTNLRG